MLIVGGNQLAAGYEVDNSLRFDDGSSDYLSRTGSTGNRKTLTISYWLKRSNITTANSQGVLNAGILTNGDNHSYCGFEFSTDTAVIQTTTSNSNIMSLQSNALFRDVSAWYHFVWKVDTTQATESDRVTLYVNGVEFSLTGTFPSLNQDTWFNYADTHQVGTRFANYLNGYLTEMILIDGTALDSTSFGEFDEDSGIWKPIDVSGLTFGTNGFYLPFENSAALGQDDSGNGNNFTVNNLTSIDQTTDTPTNNFATLNPLHFGTTIPSSYSSLSEGNTKFVSTQGGSPYPYYFSTMAVSQGKWYAEFKRVQGTAMIGLGSTPAEYLGNSSTDAGYYTPQGNIYTSDTPTSYGDIFSDNDILGVAMDLDNNAVYFSRNGVWQNSGVPTSGASKTGAYSITDPSSFPSGVYHFAVGDSGPSTATVESNFGNPPFTISSGNSDANGYGNFEYAVPSGYYALNTKNLAEYG